MLFVVHQGNEKDIFYLTENISFICVPIIKYQWVLKWPLTRIGIITLQSVLSFHPFCYWQAGKCNPNTEKDNDKPFCNYWL